MLIENLLLFPKQKDILKNPLGKQHPLMMNNSMSPSQQNQLFVRILQTTS